jgi:hypothetical protein
MADFASGVAFKASLFVRDSAQPSLDPVAENILDAFAAAPKVQGQPNDHAPVVRRVWEALSDVWPEATGLRELATRCGVIPVSVARAALVLTAEGRADIELYPPAWAASSPERPVASALARAQARAGPEVTSLRHIQVSLDDERASALLTLMDGTRDREALVEELLKLGDIDRSEAATSVDQYVKRLAELGLLRRPGPAPSASPR